jgi:hypothetical protein
MKFHQFLKQNQCFFISVAAVAIVSNRLRDPFEFEQEVVHVVQTEPVKPAKDFGNLGKWNIKEMGNDLLIMENDEGHIRTIQVSQ